ncbi:MAG: transketolase [Candidatus Riflebacteria bacterium]|nr:transketolase [Candidatus Riflebacteria bacterium]
MVMEVEENKLEKDVLMLRQIMFKVMYNAGGGHLASSLSIAEILAVLYEKYINVNPSKPDWEERDRFILSKGHASIALYSILAQKGFLDKKLLLKTCQKGNSLGGHPDMLKLPGVDASTGSLGHGFPFGVGIAFGGKLSKKDFKVYILMGDGECQEGSIWEAAIFANQHKLDNIVAIVDYNKLQAIDFIDNVGSLSPLDEKWRSFGWGTRVIEGHDIQQISDALSSVPFVKGKPSVIIANTTKGKGISYMENVPIWHYRMPDENEVKIALKELCLERDDLKYI